MPTITIAGTVIDFPDTGSSPLWSPAIIQFAESVQDALAGVVGAFDVPTQTLNIDAYNPGSAIDITALNFPTSDVRAAFIRYAVYRDTSSTSGVESGNLFIVYNPDGSPGSKWELSRETIGAGASITFAISDTGQISFTTTTLAGTDHVGTITFSAQALQNS
jgi:hypothetical protein